MANNVTTTELELALQQLAQAMGLSVVEYVQSLGYATVEDISLSITAIQAQIDAITELDDTNGAESLAEKIKAINDILATDAGAIEGILTQLLENKTATQTVASDLALVDARLELVKATVEDEELKVEGLETAVAGIETTIAGLGTAIEGLQAGSEAERLEALKMDICAIGNKFRTGLGLALIDCDAPTDPVDPVDPVDPTDPTDPTGSGDDLEGDGFIF